MENKIILLYWLRCCWRLKSYPKKWQQKHFSRFSLYLYYLKKWGRRRVGGVVIRAWPYILPSGLVKNTKQLVKYPRVLYFKPSKNVLYAYDETRNLIEIRGRGVKIITLPLDHDHSCEDDTYYGNLLCSTSSIAVLIYVDKTVQL